MLEFAANFSESLLVGTLGSIAATVLSCSDPNLSVEISLILSAASRGSTVHLVDKKIISKNISNTVMQIKVWML